MKNGGVMPKGANQKLKLYYLMKIMLEKTDDEHFLTMSQIMKELSAYDVTAERKSIYSDFEALEKLGIEIIGEQSGRDYYYHVGTRQFELAELKLLIDAIQSSKFITEKKSKQLIGKIKGFVSVYEARKLDRQVYVHGRIKTMNESIYYSVDDIHYAINQNKKIAFQYFKWNIKKELVPMHYGDYFTVSPWALTWDDENYYMVAFDDLSKTIKHYRVDKMMHIKVLEEAREGKELFKSFDMALYAKQNFGMYNGTLEKVSIEFPNRKCGIFIDRFGKDITLIPVDDEHVRLNIDVAISPQFFGWIFSLGSDVKIVGPESVREQVKEAAKAFIENYE